MLTIEPTDEFNKRQKRWPKKYRRELKAMSDNLDAVYNALTAGVKAKDIDAMFGFAHSEGNGVLAVD